MQRFSASQLNAITEFFEGAAEIQLERAHEVRDEVERQKRSSSSARRGPARGLAHGV